MSEQKTMQQAELPTLESAPGEKHSAVIARGISMPAHQVRIAIEQAVARGQVSEEDGEEVWWLYNYAQENHLKEADLAAKMKAYDKNTLYQLFRGSYGVSGGGKFASWNNVIKTIREFKKIEIEEMKKKNVGIIETEVKQTVWRCCDAALNDGMVSFIYGRTRIGKSIALQAYQREHNHGQTIYIEMGSGWTRTRFVRELARKFGNGVKATKPSRGRWRTRSSTRSSGATSSSWTSSTRRSRPRASGSPRRCLSSSATSATRRVAGLCSAPRRWAWSASRPGPTSRRSSS